MGASRLSRIATVASNTFRESVRERVLYNLVIFAILMTVSGLLMGELSIRQDEKIIKDIGLAAIDLFGNLIALFIGIGLVSKELERRSLYPLLAKPLGRTEFLLGKFVGLASTLAVNVAVMTAGMYATLFWTRRVVDPALLGAVYALYLVLLLVVCIALFFSTVTSPLVGMICTISMVLAGRYADVIRGAKEVAPAIPDWFISFLYVVVPNFHNFDFKAQVVYGTPVSWDTLAWLTVYAVAYGGICLSTAAVVFQKKDLA
jgi:ABC-type transport system involved in multi-copper enzyme maturation permease subunit